MTAIMGSNQRPPALPPRNSSTGNISNIKLGYSSNQSGTGRRSQSVSDTSIQPILKRGVSYDSPTAPPLPRRESRAGVDGVAGITRKSFETNCEYRSFPLKFKFKTKLSHYLHCQFKCVVCI